MASVFSSNLMSSQNLQQNSLIRNRQFVISRKKRMATDTFQASNASLGISSVLETMDRFLENNDDNHLVQLLIHLESKTSVSRKALARFLLFVVVCYFLFNIKVFDLAANILMYFLPSYGTYVLLQKTDLDKQDLIDICRYWMFTGFFITIDPALTLIIPFWSFVKVFLAFQCALPRRSPIVNGFLNTAIIPLFRSLETDSRLSSLNQFLSRQTEPSAELQSHQQ